MASRDPNDLVEYLKVRWPLLKAGYEKDHPWAELRLLCTHRPPAEQAELYAQGRTKPGPVVTKLRFGNHNYYPARAFDVGVFVSGKYMTDASTYDALGAYVQSLSLSWGGKWVSFKDRPHFEVPAGEGMIFGRQWLIKRLVGYAADQKNATRVAEWVNAKVDIPGVPEEVEAEMAQFVSTASFGIINDYMNGKHDGATQFSKRYVMLKMLTALSQNVEHAADAIDIPWLSEVSEEKIAAALHSFFTEDLIPYVEANFT